MTFTISISDTFDGGNVRFVEQRPNPHDAEILDVLVNVKPDVYTQLEDICHMQYFSFRVTVGFGHETDAPSQQRQVVNYILANADQVSYPEAWSGTTVFVGSDVNNVDAWSRNLTTHYGQGQLSWQHTHSTTDPSTCYMSYFPPYSYARHLAFHSACAAVAATNSTGDITVGTLGQSLQGREMDFVKVGRGPLVCWMIHRQHPGETMAEHYAEGLLQRLLGIRDDWYTNSNSGNNNDNKTTTTTVDPVVQQALEQFTFYIVPCLCPDGAVMGHLRTNAVGANLNREWATVQPDYAAPSLERSPEVYHVLQKMDETGVDVCLDVHGDEELPFNFINGAQFIPAWGPRLQALHGAFVAAYGRSDPSLQANIGYPPPESPEEVVRYMNVATNQISQRFDCLAMTLEMPFKDCLTVTDPERGWNPSKSRALGAHVLEALLYVQPLLRNETDFWTHLAAADQYVETTDDYETHAPDQDEGQFKLLKKRFYSDVHEFRKGHVSPTTTASGTK